MPATPGSEDARAQTRAPIDVPATKIGRSPRSFPKESHRTSKVVFLPGEISRGAALLVRVPEVHPQRDETDLRRGRGDPFHNEIPHVVRSAVRHDESGARRSGRQMHDPSPNAGTGRGRETHF